MQSYEQFVAEWAGKAADFDGAYGPQCVDLFNFYNRDVVGQGFVGTPTTGGAADLWNDYAELPGYTKVPYHAGTVPPKGAVVIWAANSPATGAAGHVGMASGEGDASYFVSFDQNYPTGSLPHMQRHSYVGVLGWYVPNNQGGDMLTPEQEDFIAWGEKAKAPGAIIVQADDYKDAEGWKEQATTPGAVIVQQSVLDGLNQKIEDVTKQYQDLVKADAAKPPQAPADPQPPSSPTPGSGTAPAGSGAVTDLSAFTIGQLLTAVVAKVFGK